jgi:hypothetical protein
VNAEHETDSPILDDDATLVVHEHRQIGFRSSGQDVRDLVVPMQDGLDEAMVRRSRHGDGNAPVENFRQPLVGFDVGRASNDSGDEAVDRADADVAASAVSAQDFVDLVIGEERGRHAATFAACSSRAAFQFQARSSRNRSFVVAPETIRSRTSVSQVSGSRLLSFAVYADRRTMPSGFVFPRFLADRRLINSA